MTEPSAIEALLSRLGHEVAQPTLPALAQFLALLELWNKRMNLTAAKGEHLLEVLFADAAVLADEALVPASARVVDVGSGAGAPALPLALLRPDLSMTLVEPLRKRVAFMRQAIGSLHLADRVTVLESRIEAASAALPPCDAAMSRATFAPERWLEVGQTLAPRVLVLTAHAEPLAAPLGAAIAATRGYTLPTSGAPRLACAYVRDDAAGPGPASR